MTRGAGFSLIEVLITIVILGILLAAGGPSMLAYLNNSKLRSTAESITNGLQRARSEAVARNASVDFLLTNAEPIAANVAATASTSGVNWIVRTNDQATYIEGKRGAEGSGRAVGESLGVQVSGSVSSVTFTGLGSATLGSTATIQVTNPTGGTCAASGGPMRCLNVTVTPGGKVRMCDPAVTAATDTRSCS